MRNTGPIFFGKNVTPQFSMCSISTNILTVLANFLGIQNSIFSKNIGRDRGNTIWEQNLSVATIDMRDKTHLPPLKHVTIEA
jgi:hypothetical protein